MLLRNYNTLVTYMQYILSYASGMVTLSVGVKKMFLLYYYFYSYMYLASTLYNGR